MRRFRREPNLRYWKPMQTGIEADDDTADVRRLERLRRRSELLDQGVRLPRPCRRIWPRGWRGTVDLDRPLVDLAWSQAETPTAGSSRARAACSCR